MENGIYQLLLDTFMKYKGVGFVSLQYTNKEGELSKRLLNLGAKLENAKKSDLELIEKGIPYVASEKWTPKDWFTALSEQRQSLLKPNENRSNGQLNGYITLNDENGSVKYNVNTQEIYLFGKSERKEVLRVGVYKTVNSSSKTLAKKQIQKALKTSQFRTLLLKNVSGTVKVNKETIVIDGEERVEEVINIVLE